MSNLLTLVAMHHHVPFGMNETNDIVVGSDMMKTLKGCIGIEKALWPSG